MSKFAISFVVVAWLAAISVAVAEGDTKYPLVVNDTGVRVKNAQWLLQGNKPSVYRDKWFRVRTAAPTGWYGPLTAKQTRELRYRLGEPKVKTSKCPGLVWGGFTVKLKRILLGQEKRPDCWVLRALARRTSGSVLLKAYPVPARGRLIGFPFTGTHRLGNWQSDNAVDIACAPGSRIVAPVPGRLFGGYGRLGIGGSRFMGQRINMAGLYRSRAVAFYLAHLSTITVQPYARVEAGQKVGTCGPANGIYHLHFGASYGFPVQSFVNGGY